jgi:hypothetical protein
LSDESGRAWSKLLWSGDSGRLGVVGLLLSISLFGWLNKLYLEERPTCGFIALMLLINDFLSLGVACLKLIWKDLWFGFWIYLLGRGLLGLFYG